MTSEPKEWVKPLRKGRMKGVLVPLDQETWETSLNESGIPLDTPLDQLRIKRYRTRSRNIVIRVKRLCDIPEEELS